MLWFGRPLGDVERLSITSFLRQGHPVHLFTYGDIGAVPAGAEILDARDVLPEREFESLRSRGVRSGVIADYFRYAMLHQRGGWWADCDVVCLKPFDFTSEFVFGWQDERVINNAVLRLPAGDPAAAALLEQCVHPARITRDDTARRAARKARDTVLGRRTIESVSWGATGPAAVTSVFRKRRLIHHAMSPEVFYPVHWEDHEVLYRPGDLGLGSASYAVHLWNEVRAARVPAADSPLGSWLTDLATIDG